MHLRYDVMRLIGVVFVSLVLFGSCKPSQKTVPLSKNPAPEGSSFVSWQEFFETPEVLENELRQGAGDANCLDGGSFIPKTTEKLVGSCSYASRKQGPYSIELARFDKSGKPFDALISFHPPIELEKLPSVLEIDEGWVAPDRIIQEADEAMISVYRDVRAPVAKKGELLKITINLRGGLVSKAALDFNTFDKEEDIYRHRLALGEPLLETKHVVPLYFGPSRTGAVGAHDVVVQLTPSETTINGARVAENDHRSTQDIIDTHVKRHFRGSDTAGTKPIKTAISPSHHTPWSRVQRVQTFLRQRRSDDQIDHINLAVARAPSFEYEMSQWYIAALEIPKAEVGLLEHYEASGGEVVIHLEPDAIYFELSGKLSTTMFGAPSDEHFLRYDPKSCSQQERFDATACLKPYINSSDETVTILGQIDNHRSKFETGAGVTTSVDFEGHSEVLSGYAPHRLGETIEYLLTSIQKKHGTRPDRVAVRPHGMLSAQVVLSMLDVIQGNVEGMNVKGECNGVLEEKSKPLRWRRCESPRFFSRVFFAID